MSPTRAEIRAKLLAEIVELAHAVANTYIAHLGGPSVFGDQRWAEARQRHWMQARETIVLGDSASWIWNLAADKFFTSRQVVDWYHAKLHLTQAATALHGEGTLAARRWLRDQETPLLHSHAERLAARSAPSRKNTRTVQTPYAAKPVTFKTTFAACNILKPAKTGSPSAAAWSKVRANNSAPAWPVQACAGRVLA